MRLLATLAVALLATGCVDTKACHTASAWKPCAGQVAEPGASGSPPSIVELSEPTCAYAATPSVTGILHVTDPDGDAQTLKVTSFSGGMRTMETELPLDDAERSGNDWSGALILQIGAQSGGTVMEGDSDVVIKVTDRAGAQSIPYCNTISIVP